MPDGNDPHARRRGGEAAGTGERRAKACRAEWERQFGKVVDLSTFEREILPLIRDVPLSRLVKATGLSLRYVSQIRRGSKYHTPGTGKCFERRATELPVGTQPSPRAWRCF
jgi:hypothetical protein